MVLVLLFCNLQEKKIGKIKRLDKFVTGAPPFKNLPASLSIAVLFNKFISSKCIRIEAFVVGGNEYLLPTKFMFLSYFLTAALPHPCEGVESFSVLIKSFTKFE